MITKNNVRIAKLTEIGLVASLIGKLFRLARRGEMALEDAKGLTTILLGLRQCLESSAVEERLAQIEEAIAQRQRENTQPFKPKVAA
jgi:hypothetical protein